MNSENDHDYFRCTLVGATERAHQVTLKSNGLTFWVPKSLSNLTIDTEAHNVGVLEVESWFAKNEGMHDEG